MPVREGAGGEQPGKAALSSTIFTLLMRLQLRAKLMSATDGRAVPTRSGHVWWPVDGTLNFVIKIPIVRNSFSASKSPGNTSAPL